jgi:hypothetical protein
LVTFGPSLNRFLDESRPALSGGQNGGLDIPRRPKSDGYG